MNVKPESIVDPVAVVTTPLVGLAAYGLKSRRKKSSVAQTPAGQ